MEEKKTPKKKFTAYFDYNLLFILMVLIGLGLVILYSASSYHAQEKYGDSIYFLKKQFKWVLIGLLPMGFFIFFDYRKLKKYVGIAYIGSLILCVLVFVPGIGVSSHGSARWIGIGPISFQPSEIAKIAIIITYAALIEKASENLTKTKDVLKILILLVPIAIVVVISNLSTAIIIVAIVIGMLFVASPAYKPFFAVGGIGMLLGVAFIFLKGYRAERFVVWLHPETESKGYQTMMGLYAIGSGKLFGKGIGSSMQKMHIPEPQNDMIFSILCEDFGLFGATCMILLYMLLIWRMMVIVSNARDLFGAMLVVGVMVQISVQVILNIGVVTNTIPNTGVSLPFVSYGGSSVIFLMMEMGIVLGVSRGIRLHAIH